MTDNFANPRLIDVFGVHFTQEEVDFAIPKLREDIPLYVDCGSSKPVRRSWWTRKSGQCPPLRRLLPDIATV